MNTRFCAVLMTAVVAMMHTADAQATIVDDQIHIWPDDRLFMPLGPTYVSGQDTVEMAQSFTVGVSGILASVSVELYVISDNNYTLSIVPLVGGIPDTTGAPLATLTQYLPAGTAQYTFDLSAANLAVDVGDELAYWMTGDFSRWVSTLASNDYAGGTSFLRFPGATDGSPTDWVALNFDAQFKTAVLVPEPGALCLMLLGAGAFTRRSARRQAA